MKEATYKEILEIINSEECDTSYFPDEFASMVNFILEGDEMEIETPGKISKGQDEVHVRILRDDESEE